MWNKQKSLTLSLFIVRVFIAALVLAVIFLSPILEWYLDYSMRSQSMMVPILMALYSSAIPAAVTLFFLHRLLRNLCRESIFVEENVHCLRIISWCCMAVGIIFTLLGFLYLFSLLIGIAAFFFGLILRVLKNVFAQAVLLKQENDFTI